MESYLEMWAPDRMLVPGTMIVGMILGAASNFYIFILFTRAHARNEAEKALRKEKLLYQMEQEQYESIKTMQMETEKIRHDYQNQVLVLQRLLREEEDGR